MWANWFNKVTTLVLVRLWWDRKRNFRLPIIWGINQLLWIHLRFKIPFRFLNIIWNLLVNLKVINILVVPAQSEVEWAIMIWITSIFCHLKLKRRQTCNKAALKNTCPREIDTWKSIKIDFRNKLRPKTLWWLDIKKRLKGPRYFWWQIKNSKIN